MRNNDFYAVIFEYNPFSLDAEMNITHKIMFNITHILIGMYSNRYQHDKWKSATEFKHRILLWDSLS